MLEIIIDEEFKGLLPPLDRETYESLEANIIENGCRDPLVLWGNTLVDGHNRYSICMEHGIPFNTTEKEFMSREAALIWIITNQVSRRNMSPAQLSYYRGLHYMAEKKIVTNESGRNQHKEVDGHNDHQPKTQSTASRIAKQYKVAEKTIRRDARVAGVINNIGEASPEAKRMVLAGDARIDKKQLETLANATNEEIAGIAELIEDGAYEKKKRETTAPKATISPADAILKSMQPLGAAIASISGSLDAKLPEITKKAERAKLKAELRSYINMLEALYGQL